MTWFELSPELMANLEGYTQMKIIWGYIGIWIVIATFLIIGIAVLVDYLQWKH